MVSYFYFFLCLFNNVFSVLSMLNMVGLKKYWNFIDARLEFIRSQSEGLPVKIARCCYLGY